MRKFLFLLLFLPMLAGAQVKVEIDGITYSVLKKGKVAEVIQKSSGKYTGSIDIPESVEYEGVVCSVNSIGSNVFYECSGLTSVAIPNSVTTIGKSAFYKCSNLSSVTIGNSVTSIGNEAFYGCSGLTSVVIPNSVTTIGSDAFVGCSGLTSVTLGNSVTSIGEYAFANCSGLASVTIPNSVTIITNQVFRRCTGLTSVTIPNSVTYIGEAAFYGCSGLTSVVIPNSVTRIGSGAFQDCSGLTSVVIGNSVTTIDERAFWKCSRLISLTIGSSVKYIGDRVFAECSDLEDVICLAKNVPSTTFSTAFDGSYIEYANLHVLPSCMSGYASTRPWYGFGNIVEDGALVTLAVGDAQWATFIAPFDVKVPEGVMAYTVDGESNGLLTLTEIPAIEANTPVVLYAEYPISKTLSSLSEAENESYTSGLLTGVYSDQEITEGYVLQKQEKVGFYAVSAENPKTVPANHAYIWKAASAEAKALFFDGEATTIEAVEVLTNGKAQIYDMNGRKLNGLQKGLNIVNGKKILVK